MQDKINELKSEIKSLKLNAKNNKLSDENIKSSIMFINKQKDQCDFFHKSNNNKESLKLNKQIFNKK